MPLEELFHELQARSAEISRDSPRSGAEMRFPSHEAPAGGGSSLQARLSGASSPTASRSPSSRRGHRLPRPRPRLLHHQRRARPSACRPSSGRSRASGWSATRRRSTSRGATCGARLARDHPRSPRDHQRSPEITRDHPETQVRRSPLPAPDERGGAGGGGGGRGDEAWPRGQVCQARLRGAGGLEAVEPARG